MDFRGLVWKQMKNYIFWSEIGSGFGETGGTGGTSHQLFPGVPPGERNLDGIGKHSKPVSPLMNSGAPCCGGGPSHWYFQNFQQPPNP